MDKELVKEITFIITGKVTNEYKRVTSIDGYKVEVLNNKELYKNIGVADMNFDIVVGNPPYQRDNGGHVSNTIIQ